MERQPYPLLGSCVDITSQRPASVETVQGGFPPYGMKETLLARGKTKTYRLWIPGVYQFDHKGQWRGYRSRCWSRNINFVQFY